MYIYIHILLLLRVSGFQFHPFGGVLVIRIREYGIGVYFVSLLFTETAFGTWGVEFGCRVFWSLA